MKIFLFLNFFQIRYEEDWWYSPSAVAARESGNRKHRKHVSQHVQHHARILEEDEEEEHHIHRERDAPKKSARHTSSKDFHAVHLGAEDQKSDSLGSRSTTQSDKKSFGCTVKGSSAIVLTPDSIVYNDNGIW